MRRIFCFVAMCVGLLGWCACEVPHRELRDRLGGMRRDWDVPNVEVYRPLHVGIQLRADKENLYVRLPGLDRFLKPTHQYMLYINERVASPHSAPSAPPRDADRKQGDPFRWRMISANPLSGDGINSNPGRVQVFTFSGQEETGFSAQAFWGDGQSPPTWQTLPDKGLDFLPDNTFAISWKNIEAGNSETTLEWMDLAVFLYDTTAEELVLAFPVANGMGPRVFANFVYSLVWHASSPDEVAVVNTAETDQSYLLFHDRFSDIQAAPWRKEVIRRGWPSEALSFKGDVLDVLAPDQAAVLDYPEVIAGNFDVAAMLAGSLRGCVGFTLYKVNAVGTGPDTNSFLRIRRRLNNDLVPVITLTAVENGQTRLEEWHQKPREAFEYVLDRAERGEKCLGFRVQRDERTGCLRPAYRYRRSIDGQERIGWMEFPTVQDWNERGFFLELVVEPDDTVPGVAAIEQVYAGITRRDDPRPSGKNFEVNWQTYTFSGMSAPGLVVEFGPAFPYADRAKFVFWSLANYIPWWHIDDKCAVSYEFVETWGGGTTWKGEEPGGCCEPMSDRLLRWSDVKIVESNDVRVVVDWTYVLVNPEYQWWGRDPKQRPWVRERYTFYPDGVGVRKVTYYPVTNSIHKINWNEISEPMMVHRGGIFPSECLSTTPLTMLNLDGDRHDFRYLDENAHLIPEDLRFWNHAVVMINLNNRPSVFEVFSQADGSYRKTFPKDYSKWWGKYENKWHVERKDGYEYKDDYWPFSHWPISRIPYEEHTKSNSRYLREPGHTSIMGIPGHPGATEPVTWAMLIGLTRPDNDQGLRRRTSSWLYPGDVTMSDAFAEFVEVDFYTRAITFRCVSKEPRCAFRIKPTPMISYPVFAVRDWPGGLPGVWVDGKLLKKERYRTAIEDGQLLVWIEGVFQKAYDIIIAPIPGS